MQAAIDQISLGTDQEDGGQTWIAEKTDRRAEKTKSRIVTINKRRGLDNTVTRWQKSTGNVTGPLKSYAKQIL